MQGSRDRDWKAIGTAEVAIGSALGTRLADCSKP